MEINTCPERILSKVRFRTVYPTDIPTCFEIEKSSYPPDEAASLSALQYRQHHASTYFRCAVIAHNKNEEGTVIGFVCSTRCQEFRHETMSSHDPAGPLLAIHSVVVHEKYRRQGIAMTMMKDYIDGVEKLQDGIDTLVLLAKSDLLSFYVRCGFCVMRVSEIQHGKDLWYECERSLRVAKSPKDEFPCWIVDSFAEAGGTGNQAAVVLLPSVDESEAEWMMTVAKEFNHSETAFIWSLDAKENDEYGDGDSQIKHFGIRFFTKTGTEVDLCGHATLASGSVLFQRLPFKVNDDACIRFSANKDLLEVKPDMKTWYRNGRFMKIKMNFPQKKLLDITVPSDRSAVLKMLKEAFMMENTAENILYMGLDQDGEDILIEVTYDCFGTLGYDKINYTALTEWDGYSRGVILCCRQPQPAATNELISEHEDRIDFLSRFFGPKAGIEEDPVTGSAHCRLGPYFCAKLDKSTVIGRQASVRGGIVECILKGDGRMEITGSAVTTVRGTLTL